MLKSVFLISKALFRFIFVALLIVLLNLFYFIVVPKTPFLDLIYSDTIYTLTVLYILILLISIKCKKDVLKNFLLKYKWCFLVPTLFMFNENYIYIRCFYLFLPIVFYLLVKTFEQIPIIKKCFFSKKEILIFFYIFLLLDLPCIINAIIIFLEDKTIINNDAFQLYVLFSFTYKYLPFYIVSFFNKQKC